MSLSLPLTFCPLRKLKETEPQPGELYVWPRDENDHVGMAGLVLSQGEAVLRQGSGPAERILVSDDPTFEDMLTAMFVQRRLAGEETFPGLAAFARYAEIAHEGRRPDDLPVAASMEGVFLAIRGAGGPHLSESLPTRRFLLGWGRMVAVILQAAQAGVDPFVTPLFATSEFAREHVYLAGDEALYRQDVLRGERWWVRHPDLPPEGAPLLVLDRPKSLLFKHWARLDTQATGGRGYPIMAVDWGESEWVISTDPRLQISLLPLHARYQEAEKAVAGKGGWFDGKRFAHTLIATPHGGTKLTRRAVLRDLGKWAERQKPGRRVAVWAGTALAVCLLLVVGYLWRIGALDAAEPAPTSLVVVQEKQLVSSRGQGPQTEQVAEFPVPNRTGAPAAVAFQVTIEDPDRSLSPNDVAVVLEMGKERLDGVKFLARGGKLESTRKEVKPTSAGVVLRVRVRQLSTDRRDIRVRTTWGDPQKEAQVFLLAVGISRPEAGFSELQGPENDVTELTKVLKPHLGDTLKSKCGTAKGIREQLGVLASTAASNGITSNDLVILWFSGHGTTQHGSFYFVPGIGEAKAPAVGRDAVPWDYALPWRDVVNAVKQCPCKVVVVLDACHSGAADLSAAEWEEAVTGSSDRSQRGLFLLCACTGEQKTFDVKTSDGPSHGSLALALLELFRGTPMSPEGAAKSSKLLDFFRDEDEITLETFREYATQRAKLLHGKRSLVVFKQLGNVPPELVVLARRPKSAGGGKKVTSGH